MGKFITGCIIAVIDCDRAFCLFLQQTSSQWGFAHKNMGWTIRPILIGSLPAPPWHFSVPYRLLYRVIGVLIGSAWKLSKAALLTRHTAKRQREAERHRARTRTLYSTESRCCSPHSGFHWVLAYSQKPRVNSVTTNDGLALSCHD